LEEARAILREALGDPAFADNALAYRASLVDLPEPVVPTVAQLTGHPARTFRQWALDHTADFPPHL
jgi:hypothetical protein